MKVNVILLTLAFFFCQSHGMNLQKDLATLQARLAELNAILLSQATPSPALAFNIKKINDDLYVGKVEDGFYLAMERIDDKNIDMWLEYANLQYKFAEQNRRDSKKFLPDLSGSDYFRVVLEGYRNRVPNDLWVAYASNKPIKKKAILTTNPPDKTANANIEMYVTVITSPRALITSHMGISRTYTMAYNLSTNPSKTKRHPDQSIHLHSFAAKVMKLLDDKKVYMLTLPTPIMRNILLKKMPVGSVFVGDNNYADGVRRNTTFTDYEENMELLKNNPPRIVIYDDGEITIQNKDGSPLVTFRPKTTTAYEWLSTFAYIKIFNPYVLTDLNELANVTKLVPYDE